MPLLTELHSAAPSATTPGAALEPITFPDVKDADGQPRTSRVKPINGRGMKLLRKMGAGDKDPTLLWQIAAELLPDLTPDEIDKLTMDEASTVLAYATGQLAAAEAEIAASGAPTSSEAADPQTAAA